MIYVIFFMFVELRFYIEMNAAATIDCPLQVIKYSGQSAF